MSMAKGCWGAALAVSAASFSMGCGSKAETPTAPYPDGGYVYDAGLPPPLPDAGTPPPLPQTTPCDPVQSGAVSTMFMARQKGEAPGMQPEGAPVCGVVPDGQSVTGPTFVLQPGHCYTVFAQGLPNVSQVNVEIDLDASGLPPALAMLAGKPVLAVGTAGAQPVQATIGAKNDCYAWPWPIPAAVKLVVKSQGGSGVVAAQAYSKKK